MSAQSGGTVEDECIVCGYVGDDVELVVGIPLCGPCDDATNDAQLGRHDA